MLRAVTPGAFDPLRGFAPALRRRRALAVGGARRGARYPALEVDGRRSRRREPPELRLVLPESDRRASARGCGRRAAQRGEHAAVPASRRARQAVGGLADRARRSEEGRALRQRRDLLAPRARARLPRRRDLERAPHLRRTRPRGGPPRDRRRALPRAGLVVT